jgi:glycosyltransferase involved in cell wall biosynthesis
MAFKEGNQEKSCQVKDPLRVLELVNVRWWNACAEYGINVALGLQRRGHHVIVAGQGDSPPLRRAGELGLRVHATRMSSPGPVALTASLKDLIALIRHERIQVLNAHRAEGHLFSILASLMLGRRVAVVRTRGDIRPPKSHRLNRWLHLSRTDAVVLPAEALRQPVRESLGQTPARLEVIAPGVDASGYTSTLTPQQGRLALGWPEKKTLVGIVGRLSPVKGHRIFLKAARQTLSECPHVTFAVVGGGDERSSSELRRLAERLGIADRVRFTGRVDQTRRYIEAFNVAVVASIGSEAICRVALEYMALGRPVVGTRVNAVPEVVAHGTTGLLVPPGDPQAMSRALVTLLKDPHRARTYGLAGRRRVENEFTLDHLAGRTEALYRKVMKDRCLS